MVDFYLTPLEYQAIRTDHFVFWQASANGRGRGLWDVIRTVGTSITSPRVSKKALQHEVSVDYYSRLFFIYPIAQSIYWSEIFFFVL